MTRPVLKRGAQGTEVGELQTLLGLTPDRIFGVLTETAVRAYQTSHGLTSDGIVGRNTWSLLLGVEAQPATTYPLLQARHFRKGRIKPVELIVIHSMEAPEKGSTAENIARYFQTIERPASAHLCIDNDSIVQCVRFTDTAYHCKNANANGVGIEHAGYARQTEKEWLDEYGIAMLELSAQAAAKLCRQFKIPAMRAAFRSSSNSAVVQRGFCGHADVPSHGSHWDPGKGFPWGYYLERVRHYLEVGR